MIYVLDCGHSAETKGKRSPDGSFYEYAYNREIGKMVSKQLDELGIKNYFTYNTDRKDDLGLSKRAAQANAYARGIGAGNCLFISLHSNAAGDGKRWMNAQGWECYTTVGRNNSDKYAEIFYEEAEKIAAKYGRKVRKDMSDGDKDKESNFTVIYKTICPSILIESWFYDNKDELEWMTSDEGKQATVDIIVNAIKRIENKD